MCMLFLCGFTVVSHTPRVLFPGLRRSAVWLYREEPVEIGCDVVLAIGKPRASPLLSLNTSAVI